MKICVKDSTIIRPARETPKYSLRTSVLDLSVPATHISFLYFYGRPNDSFNFFDSNLLKEALSNVLVPFYPVAGRLGRDENGRIQIRCNGQGVLFLEAETSCTIDDLGDFESNWELMQLLPTVDYTKDISSYPLLLAQVNHLKCGGVCLGVLLHHTLADATSIYQFVNKWAQMARGIPVSIPPFFDRTALDLEAPNSATFHDIKYKYNPPPTTNTLAQNTEFQSNPESISTAILKLSPDQLNTLKQKYSITKYTRFEILAAHIWRCACKACGSSDDQISKLYIAVNGRSKLIYHSVPSEFFGNVVFSAKVVSTSGDIQSKSLTYTVDKVHKAIERMDDKYLKSVLVFLKQRPDLMALKQGFEIYKCPDLYMSKVVSMPMYDANFGWGGQCSRCQLLLLKD